MDKLADKLPSSSPLRPQIQTAHNNYNHPRIPCQLRYHRSAAPYPVEVKKEKQRVVPKREGIGIKDTVRRLSREETRNRRVVRQISGGEIRMRNRISVRLI